MVVQDIFAKQFVSKLLTDKKYNDLYGMAKYLLEQRKKITEEISPDIMTYLDMGPMGFVTYMRDKHPNEINSCLDKHLYQQVYDLHKKRYDDIQHRMNFKKRTFVGFEYYKKNTDKHNKGDLKKVIFSEKDTPLAKCLGYLAKYGYKDILSYIRENIGACKESKRKNYENIFRCLDKFGEERIMRLANARRNRVLRVFVDKPIQFESLTFSGRSRRKEIIGYNKRYGSKINAFITLSWEKNNPINIPVTYCERYHGNINEYKKNSNDYEYTITFNESRKYVNIWITKHDERYIPEVNEKSEVIGIDVNIKHNLFSLSDGSCYDYDRELVHEYCKLTSEINKRKKKDKKYITGKRLSKKLKALRKKMSCSEDSIISRMCKDLKEQGYKHVVMENLDNGFGKCYVKDKDNSEVNFNDKVKFIGLSSLKQKVEHIARNYDIATSTVHPHYTSKMCPVCGCIEDENRPSQETFECIECGHKNNADTNAAINIKNRVLVTVLRDRLLKQLDNGAYEPRKLKKEEVKKVLLSCRMSANPINHDGACVGNDLYS